MFRIKRTKSAPGMAMTPPAVHYATGVTPRGCLAGLTEDKDKAALVDADMVAKVKAYYARRENAGKLDFEPIAEVQATAPVAPVKPVEIKAVEAKPEPKASEPEKGRKAVTK